MPLEALDDGMADLHTCRLGAREVAVGEEEVPILDGTFRALEVEEGIADHLDPGGPRRVDLVSDLRMSARVAAREVLPCHDPALVQISEGLVESVAVRDCGPLALGIELGGKRLVGLDASDASEQGRLQLEVVEAVLEAIEGGLLDVVGVEKPGRDLLADKLPHLLDMGGGAAFSHRTPL